MSSFEPPKSPNARAGKLAHAIYIVLSGAPASAGVLLLALEGMRRSNDPTQLSNPRLIPACMKLLGHYRKESTICQSKEGVLCLCLMSLSLQFILLLNRPAALPFSAVAFPDYVSGVTDCISTMLRIEIRAYEQHAARTNPPRSISVPCLSSADAAKLLNWLHEERYEFLRRRRNTPDDLLGLPVLFYGIWTYLRRKGNFDCESAEGKLHDLVCRFACRKSNFDHEELLVTTLVSCTKDLAMASNSPRNWFENDNPDVLLGLLEVTSYDQRVKQSPLSLDASLAFMEWAADYVMPIVPAWVTMFLEASYVPLRSAVDQTKSNPPPTPEEINGIATYLDRLLQQTRRSLEWPDLHYTATEKVADYVGETHFFAMLAQVLLIRATTATSGWNIKDRVKTRRVHDSLLVQIQHFGDTLLNHCRPYLSKFKDSHADWFKTMIHLQEGCRTINQDEFTETYIFHCLSVWEKLGEVFWKTSGARTVVCSYPRCPYPVLAGKSGCSGCESFKGCRRLQWAEHVHRGLEAGFEKR